MVKLPNDLENNLKNSAMKQGIVGLELDQFLGQWAHESGNFTQFDEMYRNGEAFKSKKWFIDHYWKNERIRKALGNKHPNDAWMYRGRGFCQLTGRGNYEQAGKALGIDLANKPNLAANPKYMESIAIWYWKNRVATKVDAEHMGDTTAVSRAINHGESKENIQKRHTWVQWFRNVFGRGA
jgi:putative chitinase